jgi:hypothetical protein
MKTLYYFSLFTLLITSCGKECKTYYSFEMPVTISPVKDTISIGDTLWLEINVTSMLKDRESNTLIDVKNQMLTWDQNMTIFFRKIVNTSNSIAEQEDAVSKFDFFYEKGKLVDYTGNLAKGIEFNYENGNYSIIAGIIPKDSGIYFLTFHFDDKSTDVHDSEFDVNLVDTKCEEVLSQIYYEVNEGNNGSYDTNPEIVNENTENGLHIGEETRVVYSFIVE